MTTIKLSAKISNWGAPNICTLPKYFFSYEHTSTSSSLWALRAQKNLMSTSIKHFSDLMSTSTIPCSGPSSALWVYCKHNQQNHNVLKLLQVQLIDCPGTISFTFHVAWPKMYKARIQVVKIVKYIEFNSQWSNGLYKQHSWKLLTPQRCFVMI